MSGTMSIALSGRDRALLRAVAAGRCLLDADCEPVLMVDGLACADSAAARRLIDAGLLEPPARPHVLSVAVLTAAGRRVAGTAPAAAAS